MLVICLVASACTTLPKKAIKPKVELVSVVPLNISLSEQKLRFTLNVVNPNNFELPVESVDFIARFNDTDIASGKSRIYASGFSNGGAMVKT